MKIILGCILGGIFCLGWAGSAMAETIAFEDPIFPELVLSPRALAMGNAYLARVDDASAAFYNPAGLGSIRDPLFSISNFMLEANQDWFSIEGQGRDSKTLQRLKNGFDVNGIREMLLYNPGKRMHQRFQVMPNVTMRYLSFGYFFSKVVWGAVGTEHTDYYLFATRRDHGPYLASNLSLGGGIFKIGLSVQYLFRQEAMGSINPNQEVDLDLYNAEGASLVINGGAKLTLPIAWLPTLAVAWHNIGGTTFVQKGANYLRTIRETIDVGLGVTPLLSHETRLHLEVNYKDIRPQYRALNNMRKLLAGIEFDIHRVLYLRLGYGDGYMSGGFGLKTREMSFDLTAYQVNTTFNDSYDGPEDKRIALGVSWGLHD